MFDRCPQCGEPKRTGNSLCIRCQWPGVIVCVSDVGISFRVSSEGLPPAGNGADTPDAPGAETGSLTGRQAKSARHHNTGLSGGTPSAGAVGSGGERP